MKDLKRKMTTAAARYRDTESVVKNLKPQLAAARRTLKTAAAARAVVQAFAEGVQNATHQKLSKFVTKCLRAVFDDPYTFHIRFTKRRGKTHAKFVYTKGKEEYDPVDESGGGVLDVTTFGLRVAAVRALGGMQTLFLDEPFKHLDGERIPRAAKLVEGVSRELGMQIVLTTHNKNLRCGKVLRVKNGKVSDEPV